MRNLATLITSIAIATLFTAAPAHAAEKPTDKRTTPVVTKTSDGPVQVVTPAQAKALQTAQGKSPSPEQAEAMAASSCRSQSRTTWTENVYGGTLYSFYLKLTWCYDGYTVTWASHEASTSTGYGWYFDSWSNPPGWYHNIPQYTTVTAYGQAKFCITWCAGTGYLGSQIIGRADGSSSTGPL